MKPDIKIEKHGDVILLRPLTVPAKHWMNQNLDGMWFKRALAVEQGVVKALAKDARLNGLVVA